MSKIDIHNYEAYLLDFSDGNLTHDQQVELEVFLMQHPELNIDLSELPKFSLISEGIYFDNKQSLKKSSKDLISENTFIGYIENQLSETGKLKVEKDCFENPRLAKELNLYQQTKVLPDTTIVFSNKHELKKKTKIIWFNFSPKHFAAAASVLLLIGLFILWTTKNETKNGLVSTINVIKKLVAFETKNPIIKNSNVESNKVGRHNPINVTAYKKQKNINVTSKPNTVTQHNLKSEKDTQLSEHIDSTEIRGLASQTQNNEVKDKLSQNIDNIKTGIQINPTQVLVEKDDELVITPTQKRKKGLWALAEKTLKRLNKLGVKAVNGTETSANDISSYTLNIGKLSIKHKGDRGL